MKTLFLLPVVMMFAGSVRAADMVVQRVEGDVQVRHGVTETWTRVAIGDILRPDDTIKTGIGASAVILVPGSGENTPSGKIALPAQVIVDLSDVRILSPEDLMLKLTMEKVRASTYEKKEDRPRLPRAAVVHGENMNGNSSLAGEDLTVGQFLLNGTRVLSLNGYHGTSTLRALEVFRRFPVLASGFDNRWFLADVMEKARLRGEALAEFGALFDLPGITPSQKAMVQSRIEKLRK